MITDILAETLRAVFGMPASCVLKEEENQIIVRVFLVPEERKDSLEDAIYDLEESLCPNKNFFFSVITYTTEETQRYYPNMAGASPTQPREEIMVGKMAVSSSIPVGESRDLPKAA